MPNWRIDAHINICSRWLWAQLGWLTSGVSSSAPQLSAQSQRASKKRFRAGTDLDSSSSDSIDSVKDVLSVHDSTLNLNMWQCKYLLFHLFVFHKTDCWKTTLTSVRTDLVMSFAAAHSSTFIRQHAHYNCAISAFALKYWLTIPLPCLGFEEGPEVPLQAAAAASIRCRLPDSWR